MQGIRNETEIRLVGLRRSGNHAILNWLACLFGKPVCFVNDITGRDRKLPGNESSDPLPSLAKEDCVELSRQKKLLLYSYEEKRLLFIRDHQPAHEAFGMSERKRTVMVLRDPFNTFASRLRIMRDRPDNQFVWDFMLPGEDGKPFLPELWKRYAREFLGETTHLGPDTVPINYNRWFCEPAYRMELCGRLEVEPSDAGLDRVARYGFGSSFDGLEFDGKSSQMSVLNRWESFKDDEIFRSLVADPELRELSDRIFGPILH